MNCHRSATPAPAAHTVRGFTLIELILVIIMLGILAVYAGPRMFNNQDFYAKGFHDETLAYLRYAQKTAIAQRRTVCVAFGSNSLSLSVASAAGAGDCSAVEIDFTGPRGESPPTVTAKGTVTYIGAPAALNFNGLGQPTTGAGVVLVAPRTIQVSGVTNTITVEAATGYVHE